VSFFFLFSLKGVFSSLHTLLVLTPFFGYMWQIFQANDFTFKDTDIEVGGNPS